MSPVAVHLILLAAQVCFASLPVAGRLALTGGHLPPGAIVLARMVGGAIVFTLIALRRGTYRIHREDLLRLIACTVLGLAANQTLFLQGLARSTATNASVLGATIPVFTALAAIVIGREPPRMRRLVGIAIAFIGAALLVGGDRLSTSNEHLVGSAMLLTNSLCYGTYLVVVRPLAAKYDPVALLAIMFTLAVPMVAPLGIAESMSAPPFVADNLGYFAFLIAVPTVGAYALVQIALRHAEATLVAAYIYLQPIFAAAGAMLLLGEVVTARMIACGAVVLFGVWLAARSRP